MSLPSDDKNDLERAKLIESTSTSGQVAVAVVNPDGSNISGGSGGGDGAIVDGASSSIKATVLDYTSSNPLAVRLTDTDGNYVGAGAGTQYTDAEDDATPTGTVAMGTDGSNVYAVHTDTSGDLQVDVLTVPETNVNLQAGDGTDITQTGGALDVNIASGSSAGTEYSDGDARGAATGGLIMGDDGTNIQSVAVDSSGDLQVDVKSSALPTGAASAANQSTIIGHIDGIEGLLTTIDADTGNIDTSLNNIEAGYATEGSALGSGVLLQGDDGTDRKNINVDATTGDVQVDVTNTVTVDLGANNDVTLATLPDTAASDLATINSNTDSLAVVGGGTEATALRVTIANNSTGVVSVDDNGGSLTVDGTVTETNSAAILADTANIDTNVGTIAGAVSGSEMQVDVVGSLPAGTNAIGKLAANSGVDIGDVDVLSVVPGTGSTNLGKAEDAAHANGHTGVMALGVRNDSNATSFSGTNGDYTPLAVDANGNLQVDVLSAPTTTVTGAVTANLSATDNTVLDAIQTATEATRTAVETLDNIVSGSEAQVDIVGSLPAGTNAIGKLSANSGVDIGDVDVTSISAGSNLIGDVGIQGRASGGLSTYYDSDLDETAVAVKASAGTIYAIEAFNTTDAPLFLQLFNIAQGSVTVGTTTPTNQWVIPGNADSDGAGFTMNVPQGIAYGTAITAACSTNSEGNTAPGAGACIVNIHYK